MYWFIFIYEYMCVGYTHAHTLRFTVESLGVRIETYSLWC